MLVAVLGALLSLTVTGHVVDENNVPVAGARIVVRVAGSPNVVYETKSDPTGTFTLVLPQAGDFLFQVSRDGSAGSRGFRTGDGYGGLPDVGALGLVGRDVSGE